MRISPTNRPRNGLRHGDVSYITLYVPDLARGREFYGAVLGWGFSPGSSSHGVQVDDIVPMMGMADGEQPGGGHRHGAMLSFRVDDITAAVGAVRASGGTVDDPHREAYAMAAEGHDNQGIPLSLHEMPAAPADGAPPDAAFGQSDIEGDVSYLMMVVRDLDAARTFYGGVFRWVFDNGRLVGVVPEIGLTTAPEAGPAPTGVILCYRVDDIAAATERVREAGGQAREVAQRPYGLEALCADDQGTPFYLHQF